jgi:two-component system NtrC family response regulator
MKPKLLIVDDDEDIRTQMKWALSQDYELFEASDRPTAVASFDETKPPLVTLDLGLPPRAQDAEEGFALLDDILSRRKATKVVVITGRQERQHALAAIDQGAFDFFSKPIEIEELKVVLRRALHVYQLERENRELQQRMGESSQGMLGTSREMQELFGAIARVARSDAPVLVVGESGTGKELAARAIHQQSERAEGPFVVINCGAIPENLLESELFGHEKGAFTGAHIQRKGRIELAHGGTLFLDEVGELPPSLQVKLLRFLQEHRIERIGGRKEIPVDVRVLAATNTDLKKAMSEGRFREDLFYRLAVVTIKQPPLRERGEDIPFLAKAFLQRYAAENKKRITGFTDDALSALLAHDWPGNVRELENRVKRAVIWAEGNRIAPSDLELAGSAAAGAAGRGPGLKEAREALERDMVRATLVRNRGNITKAAAELGISRPTLYELMEKLGIRKEA